MISFVNFMRDFVSDFVNGQSELRLWRCNVGRLCWRWCFVRVLVCGGLLGSIMAGAYVEERDVRTRHYISTTSLVIELVQLLSRPFEHYQKRLNTITHYHLISNAESICESHHRLLQQDLTYDS